MKRILVILALMTSFFYVLAEEAENVSLKPKFEWSVDFTTHFDNRECDDLYTRNETYFFTRLAPEIGLTLDGGKHRVMGGAVWVQPIGCEWDGNRVSPVLYYKYKVPKLDFCLGFVPRSNLKGRLPNFLESDSTRYFQYTFRGGIVNYATDQGYFQGIIDWRGMQSENRREAFCVIGGGEWNIIKRKLYFGGIGMLNHLALTRPVGKNQFVIDNLLGNAYFGTDLSEFTPFKEIKLNVGILASLNRDRGNRKWMKAMGLWVDFNMEWWRLRLKNTAYVSQNPLFPLYGKYGHILYEGEPYYASKYYDRLTFEGILLKYKNIVELTADLDFNFAQNNMTFYQRLNLSVRF